MTTQLTFPRIDPIEAAHDILAKDFDDERIHSVARAFLQLGIDHDELIESLSQAMPGEDKYSNNPDGAEEGEILAFIEWATKTYLAIYDAREALDFETDGSLRFALTDGLLTQTPPTSRPIPLEEFAQAIADFFWGCQSGEKTGGIVNDGDRNFALELLHKFQITEKVTAERNIIFTAEQLDALLPGSAILDKQGIVWTKYLPTHRSPSADPRWHSTDYGAMNHPLHYGPFTVLHRAAEANTEGTLR